MNMEVATTEPDVEVSVRAPLIDTDIPAEPATAADEKKTDIPPQGEEKTETPEQQEVKKESRRQRKWQREHDARIATETENRILREELAKRDTKPQTDGEPKREQFEDYESYLRAVTKYDAEQVTDKRLKADREANQGKETQTKQSEAEQATAKSWVEREKAFIGTNKDYEEAVTPYVEEDLGQLSDGARRLIVDSELGPQVLHHLATNPEVHERIAKLSPIRQVVELGKLEDKFAPKEAAQGKKISDAPAPIRPATGTASTQTGYKESMTSAEYATWKASQMRH